MGEEEDPPRSKAFLKVEVRRVEILSVASFSSDRRLEEKLGSEWFHRWHEGLPRYDKVPGEIHIHEILRLWNFAAGLDMVSFAKMRYNLLGQAEHWFPGKNAGEVDQHDLSACLKGSPFADVIPGRLKEAHALLFEEPKKRLSEGG